MISIAALFGTIGKGILGLRSSWSFANTVDLLRSFTTAIAFNKKERPFLLSHLELMKIPIAISTNPPRFNGFRVSLFKNVLNKMESAGTAKRYGDT